MPPCCGIDTVGGVPPGSGAAAAAAEWTERYLGNFIAAPVVDLAAGTNPTVTVANSTTTADQVASAVWTSNAGDATGTVTQGSVTTFDTDGATGLRMVGAIASTLFTNVSHNAPHIWTFWDLLLGEDPRSGVDICYLAMFASQNVNFNGHACGCGLYEVNDGVVNPTLAGNPAVDDEKRLSGWIEQISGNVGVSSREESTPFQQLFGAGLPGGFDVVGLMFSGRGLAQAVVGVSAGGVFPDPDTLIPVPGPFFGGSQTYPSHPFLVPEERVALAFQQQLTASYNATISRVQVSTRGGRTTP